jgi:1,4-alpha-glucan branching enzyme
MMPHRPVAIEVVDNRVVAPAAIKPSKRVEHLLGVRAVTGGLLFVQPASIGETVQIAASFNAWNPVKSPLRLNEELGIFEYHCKLPVGSYEYKLVVDGQWVLDGHNPTSIKNDVGSQNSIARVRA